jgi:nucleotide-binding universal stress UspA family protein
MTKSLIQSIVHPTDFSEAGLDAFVHAVRLAATAGGVLHILHDERDLGSEDEVLGNEDQLTAWSQLPHVQEMLAQWRLSEPDAAQYPKTNKPGVKVVKGVIESGHPAQGIGAYVERHPCDLLVLMTHARIGLENWFHQSVAEAVARRVHAPTLFLREGQRGFVNRETGVMSLKTILFPIDGNLPHQEAGQWIANFARVFVPNALVHPLHVGLSPPANAKEFSGAIDVRTGPVAGTIVAVAEEIGADVIAMPTAGRHGLLDEFLGSDTEHVLHESPCPVLTIPV